MEKCSHCAIISSQNVKAMWSKICGYHPAADYTKRRYIGTHGDQSTHKLIPEYTQHQGWLCPKCLKALSAYQVKKFTDLPTSPKEKKEKQSPLNLWDAFH